MRTLTLGDPPSLIANINSTIENHSSDTILTVQKLLRIIGISRTDLHRKLQKNFGMSATEYIRYLRLLKAAKMLKEQPDKCICQIAMEAGFQNQSYFTKRFKEMFGICPIKYRCEA